MPLEETCRYFIGQLILVKPVYGWGWSRLDKPEIRVPDEINGVPRSFKCRVTEFLYYQNMMNGAVGKIEESAHIYHGLWTFFYLRVQGTFNFTDELGHYNLEIGPRPPEKPAGKEWLEFTSGSPIVNGYAIVAENQERIDKYDAIQNERWKITRGTVNFDS